MKGWRLDIRILACACCFWLSNRIARIGQKISGLPYDRGIPEKGEYDPENPSFKDYVQLLNAAHAERLGLK